MFLNFGALHVLQSNNRRKFTAKMIKELVSLWPNLMLVNGRPCYPQNQGSVERSNATLKDLLISCMHGKNITNLKNGLRFVQWYKNTTFNEAIKTKPYKALFWIKTRIELRTF